MRSPLKLALLFASIVTTAAAAAPAKPAPCPAGKRPTLSGCASTTPSIRTTRVAEKTTPAARPVDDPGTQLRPDVPLAHRDRALLVQEIAELESLLQETHPKAPDRAGLVLRLANDYAELTAMAEREHTLRELEADAAREEMNRSDRAREQSKNTDGPTKKPAGPPRRPIRF